MTKYAQIVMGPAGTGKSTYCKLIQEHCQNLGRAVHVVNLDPAAEEFGYEVSFDVRDLISVQDVMEELEYGPNGGLIFCMEYLLDNMEWLDEALDSFGDDDYLLLDCPGQIELYSHLPIMKTVAKHLADRDFRVVGVYLMDALFVTDAAKLLAGNLAALSAMVAMETPHINVLTKCDLVQSDLSTVLMPSGKELAGALSDRTPPKYARLNRAFATLLDDYNMVSFVPLDATDEDSVGYALGMVDQAIQYGEDMEPKEPRDEVDQDAVQAASESFASLGGGAVAAGGMG
ncbi:gpn3 [Symbiodinium sp. KB8]|nr:gpn3 [Symbiodinium sp. KB8]